jgi:hypothetical protein
MNPNNRFAFGSSYYASVHAGGSPLISADIPMSGGDFSYQTKGVTIRFQSQYPSEFTTVVVLDPSHQPRPVLLTIAARRKLRLGLAPLFPQRRSVLA